jgi:hypothetical protein
MIGFDPKGVASPRLSAESSGPCDHSPLAHEA